MPGTSRNHAGELDVRGPDVRDPRIAASIHRYWRRNLRIMVVLLGIWAFAGLGCGVVLAEWLNRFHLAGFPLGFWFAQQGSILVFVALILVYGLALNRLDADHHRDLERIRSDPPHPGATPAENGEAHGAQP